MFTRTLLISLIMTAHSLSAIAATNMTGRQIYEKVNARFDGEQVTRNFTLKLTDRRNVTRVQKTQGFRKYFGDERRIVLFYTEPNNVRGTGFMTYDYAEASKDDDQWLYLPALRKVRRISASDRGDYFLGTDLTYEEIRKEGKVEIEDYTYEVLGEAEVDGFNTLKVQSTPINDVIAKEIGYSKVISFIDPKIWMSRKAEYWDVNGNRLKTIENRDIQQIDKIWTTTKITVNNHKTEHRTEITFYDIDYGTPVADKIFTQQALKRGLR
ncbi:MAG: outer membrane lipoprotein-sorting protein [Arenicella sp.]